MKTKRSPKRQRDYLATRERLWQELIRSMPEHWNLLLAIPAGYRIHEIMEELGLHDTEGAK